MDKKKCLQDYYAQLNKEISATKLVDLIDVELFTGDEIGQKVRRRDVGRAPRPGLRKLGGGLCALPRGLRRGVQVTAVLQDVNRWQQRIQHGSIAQGGAAIELHPLDALGQRGGPARTGQQRAAGRGEEESTGARRSSRPCCATGSRPAPDRAPPRESSGS